MAKQTNPTTIDTEIWLTQKALADQLGIPVQNVHNWIRRGKIESKKIGPRITLVNKNTITINKSNS